MATTYLDLLDGVAQYYGSGSDEWAQIAKYGVTADTLPIIRQVPGVSVTVSNSGKILGYDYSYPFSSPSNPVSNIDSNVQTGSYGTGSYSASVPATTVTDSQTGTSTMQSGAVSSSIGSTIATIADRASLAISGVALGTKLGKAIDGAIYSANPEWWDEHFPTINPETWDDLASTQGGKQVIRTLFGLHGDNTTMYMDERLLAEMYLLLLENGGYGSGTETSQDSVPASKLDYPNTHYHVECGPYLDSITKPIKYPSLTWRRQYGFKSGSGYVVFLPDFPTNPNSSGDIYLCSLQPGAVGWWQENEGTIYTGVLNRTFSKGGTTVYYTPAGFGLRGSSESTLLTFGRSYCDNSNFSDNDIMMIALLGTTTVTPMDGVTDNPNASTQVDPTILINPSTGQPVAPGDNTSDVLAALKQYYPELFNQTLINPNTQQPLSPSDSAADKLATYQQYFPEIFERPIINPSTGLPFTPQDYVDNPQAIVDAIDQEYPNITSTTIYEDVPQPDGTIERIKYIPVPYPNVTDITEPVTDTTPDIDPQTTPQVNPQTRPDATTPIVDTTTTPNPPPPDTGDGNTPPVVVPVGTASALYAIYNPTQVELNSFGAWLWSSNFVDQLLKLFNDPMQAIIGLHKVYAQPIISGSSTIKVGYLDSGVSSNVVGQQYTTIDCGSIDVREYFGNVFDYAPYTRINLYLPFIGIVELDTSDVMRGTINIKYHVDVLTGACLAEINVTRDGAGGNIYTYSGNCAVQYPISSGSYMGIIASITSVAGSIIGSIATGGAMAPMVAGAVNGALHAHTSVKHSGSFSGNAGAMGNKKPYLIISRPQTAMADNYEHFTGHPSNSKVLIGEATGFIRCKEVHVENIPNATEKEKDQIESLLKNGVIL